MFERNERIIQAILIAFFAIMATGYNLGPILEGPDELQHYDFIRHIVTTGHLPDRVFEYRPERWEYHQAPLYYMIGAVIRLPVSDADYEAFTGTLGTITLIASLLPLGGHWFRHMETLTRTSSCTHPPKPSPTGEVERRWRCICCGCTPPD